MELFDKTNELINLFDIYQMLLTEKQRAYFNMYYELDYSLQEVAENFNISRNAVFDQLKKVEEILFNYEKTLNLYEKKQKRQSLLEKYYETSDMKYLEELKGMDE